MSSQGQVFGLTASDGPALSWPRPSGSRAALRRGDGGLGDDTEPARVLKPVQSAIETALLRGCRPRPAAGFAVVSI